MRPTLALLYGLLLSGCCQTESGFSRGTDGGTSYASASVAFSASTKPPPLPSLQPLPMPPSATASSSAGAPGHE